MTISERRSVSSLPKSSMSFSLYSFIKDGAMGLGTRLSPGPSKGVLIVRGGDDDIDPDSLIRGCGGRSRLPSWGHEVPELCRGDREGSRWAKEKRLFVFLWPFVVGWRLVHFRSGRFWVPIFINAEKRKNLQFHSLGFGWIRMIMSQR